MVVPSANSDDEIREIPIAGVIVDPQVRKEFEPASLHELAASLKESGQQQPILVRERGDKFRLIFGERRLRAAQLAGWTKIRAIVTQVDLTESEIVQRQLIENMQRVDLCPLEVAKGMQQLMELNGMKAGVVATRLGVSAAKVSKHLGEAPVPGPRHGSDNVNTNVQSIGGRIYALCEAAAFPVEMDRELRHQEHNPFRSESVV